jgi:hypothetical protein
LDEYYIIVLFYFVLDTPPPPPHNEYGKKDACIFIYNGDISNLTFELVNIFSTTLLTIFHLYPYSQFICRETLNPSSKNHPAATSHWIVDYPHSSI